MPQADECKTSPATFRDGDCEGPLDIAVIGWHANGLTTVSAGNLSSTGYVEDNGTSGIGQDKFWISAYGELLMPATAVANAAVLTGGNIQVPQPQGGK